MYRLRVQCTLNSQDMSLVLYIHVSPVSQKAHCVVVGHFFLEFFDLCSQLFCPGRHTSKYKLSNCYNCTFACNCSTIAIAQLSNCYDIIYYNQICAGNMYTTITLYMCMYFIHAQVLIDHTKMAALLTVVYEKTTVCSQLGQIYLPLFEGEVRCTFLVVRVDVLWQSKYLQVELLDLAPEQRQKHRQHAWSSVLNECRIQWRAIVCIYVLHIHYYSSCSLPKQCKVVRPVLHLAYRAYKTHSNTSGNRRTSKQILSTWLRWSMLLNSLPLAPVFIPPSPCWVTGLSVTVMCDPRALCVHKWMSLCFSDTREEKSGAWERHPCTRLEL